MRKFQIVTGYEGAARLPKRSTAGSAGYDFSLVDPVGLRPGQSAILKTGIKCAMEKDEVLLIFIRSSLGIKHGITLMNNVGVIDSDYYNNPDNEGHICIAIRNDGDKYWEAKPGERIAQGVFIKYLTTDNDAAEEDRRGGIGSTGVK